MVCYYKYIGIYNCVQYYIYVYSLQVCFSCSKDVDTQYNSKHVQISHMYWHNDDYIIIYILYLVNRSGFAFRKCPFLFVSETNAQRQDFHLGRVQHRQTTVYWFSVIPQRVHVINVSHEYVASYNDELPITIVVNVFFVKKDQYTN